MKKMDQSWESLQNVLDKEILNAVNDLKFLKMTPVQAATIPHFVSNKDVAVEAITGSGKTLAFVVPVMQMLHVREIPLKKQEIGAIILTPTRELAFQINEVVEHFTKFLTNFSSCLFIGGEKTVADINKFMTDGGNIVIATPGRLEDLFQRKENGFNLAASVKSLEVLVLDEADRLLDMGFETSINTILSYLPKLRRTGLFSATQTDEVQNLIRAGLRNPLQIKVKEKPSLSGSSQKTPMMLKNYYMLVEADEKFSQLVHFLQHHKKEKIMIFFSTCACVDYFSKCLQQILKKMQILMIHSKLKSKRNRVFETFRQMNNGILICTDVMARGVDIPEVHWVIQFDPPSSASAFVHRCGRTARIGHEGNALVFLLPSEDAYIKFIEINQKVPLQQMDKSNNVSEMCTRLQTFAINDRAIYQKGLRAFVSYIQSYAKHECNMILRMKDLDFSRMATGFGLLHVPKMPELKGKCLSGFQSIEVDVSTIPYKDKAREKLRLEKLQAGESLKKVKIVPHKPVAWSKNKLKKEKKKLKKEGKNHKAEKRKHDTNDNKLEDEDDDEFDNDIRLIKKLKKGKITQEEFDKDFACENNEDFKDSNETQD
ncbi:ATP-dependent RNA helicase DDX55-like [Biomphalaria glabrata]|uniref:ATP-dependent RNA helicase n=1 Tax=Biomphalaria glabrata TaxID=6526 RepID=A0A9W2YIQ8_BIOGL|nr:ATP-dependent RNA helicase DDX55-like [Biomphalaria glabrata]XP_013082411.2 ATP-dependent RNA helicase DDX55-like [Biomphalaria glabrata]XP_013082413.2 ATP-dependent RNA helicase DDX55-like [Biomphalaria glabrata]XP_013082414.2 ATP-dependent RNA helicase DDX55-like [Biomphalaria glabrata]XP_055862541.1 ATP-dependent RNA helicase DDX55-like [Biomphalaria glabrata]